MNDEKAKKDEKKNEGTHEINIDTPKLRQIIIETDGNKIRIVKADVAGDLEMSAIMRAILNNIER